MKLTIVLLTAACLHVSANTMSQNISLDLRSVELKKALVTIEKKSPYRFLYSDAALPADKKVTLMTTNASIQEIMDQLLAGTSLSYRVLQSNLVVLKNNSTLLESINEVKLSGRVVSESGDPIAGASIMIKGSKLGTTADVNGNFTLSVPDDAVIIVSAVGYETTEVNVNGKSAIVVTLKLSTKKLDEVVVIGYGTASKRDLTGSIVKVSGKEIADKPNINPVASLQSKVAGLYVVNSGTPGQAPDIRIRGTVSIGSVRPLYVVDGILNDNIDYLNPNDIESIEILKDASSLAIFGVKGATGVIAITTKRAKAGQTTINFNATYGFKKLVDKIKMANAKQFDELFAEENANNGVATPDYSALTANTDWIDAVTRVAAFSTANLSIGGSSENNKFNFGIGYQTDEGIIRHEKLQKMLVSFNDEFKVSKGIKMGVNFNYTRQHNPYDATWVLDAARKVMPHISANSKPFRVKNAYNPNGVDSVDLNIYSGLDVALQSAGVVNPILEIENTWDKTISYTDRYVGSLFAEINFLKNFSFRSTWYADLSNMDTRTYTPLYYAYNPMNNTPYLYSTRTGVNQSNLDWKKYQQDYILTFKKSFGEHSFTATGGFTTYYFGTFQRFAASQQGTGVTDLPIPNDPRLWYVGDGFFGRPVTLATPSYQSENATASILARVLYNYKGKYYLNASFRDDGSSQIPEANRHQKFWALGAAWEVSKEDFMKNVKQINFLKLKLSTGVLGNQSTYGLSSDYTGYPGLQSGINVPFGSNIVAGALPKYQPNPDLKWETVNSTDIGIELTALNNRLHFEATYFNKVTKNMMTYVDLSALGLDNKLENGGKIKNWGEEFSATWTQKLSSDLTLNINGNITFMKNKVLSVAEDLPGGIIIRGFQNNGSAEARTLPGYAIGSFFGYVVEGLYQSNLDILSSPPASSLGAYRPGDFKFKDMNGDGVIDAKDRVVIGNPSPDFIYGGAIGLNYKRLSVSIDFGGVYGNEVFRTWGSLESPFQRVNYAAFKIERWNGPGTSNWEPIISQADRFNYNGSTYNIEDGSYFRIRNFQIGYDFDVKGLSKLKVRNLRAFFNVQNLKTWKHTKGYTAEYGGDATAFGFDNAGGALPMVTTFGVNVTF
jgi:TonB-linked SusC/RagA family outer membrane protein